MQRVDWVLAVLLLLAAAALPVAFFLYLRTSYRHGGWKRVKLDLLVAIGAIGLFVLERVMENWMGTGVAHWFK
jgi:hypothetical protein